MTRTGLEIILDTLPGLLKGKRIGVVCHAASINSRYEHIVDLLAHRTDCTLSAIFGPQHGLYGQTQDNMIEWEGSRHPVLDIPVYSLYGKTRKPTAEMLQDVDVLVFDIQDVGARPYTYIWTLKLCMEACMERHIPVLVLDRPNPIGAVPMDGPMLNPEYFSFVGGAEIPLCHRLTMGEMAVLLQRSYFKTCDLHVVWMEGWQRDSLWNDTGLPWVLPSPNMPTLDTAIVYPGMVLLEATNVSEGRGTTRPFEIFGAPYLDFEEFKQVIRSYKLQGCVFREHGFIPTFQKWAGKYCYGMQIHVTDARKYLPVTATAGLLSAILKTTPLEYVFKDPPYEYEKEKMPFDILAGDTGMRTALLQNADIYDLRKSWEKKHKEFEAVFSSIAHYPESVR